MKRIEFDINVLDNIIEITPLEGMLDNSTYEIRLKNLKELNGDKILEYKVINLYTDLTPSYASLDSVKSLVESCNIPDNIILYHIRESSKFVDYIKGQAGYINAKAQVPFEVEQFVKYKSARECITRFYIDKASGSGIKGQLGDVSFDLQSKSPDISELLKSLKEQENMWLTALRGYKLEGRAKPLTAVKGRFVVDGAISNDNPPKRTEWGGN